MNRKTFIISLLSVCCCVSFAQTRSGQRPVVQPDTLATRAPADTMPARGGRVVSSDSLPQRIAFVGDSLRYRLNHPVCPEVFKFDYDPFRERMKEPWLGGLLKDILFR